MPVPPPLSYKGFTCNTIEERRVHFHPQLFRTPIVSTAVPTTRTPLDNYHPTQFPFIAALHKFRSAAHREPTFDHRKTLPPPTQSNSIFPSVPFSLMRFPLSTCYMLYAPLRVWKPENAHRVVAGGGLRFWRRLHKMLISKYTHTERTHANIAHSTV